MIVHTSSFHKWLERAAQLSISHVIHISDAEAILQHSAFKMWMDELSFKHTLQPFLFLQVYALALPLLLLVKRLFTNLLHPGKRYIPDGFLQLVIWQIDCQRIDLEPSPSATYYRTYVSIHVADDFSSWKWTLGEKMVSTNITVFTCTYGAKQHQKNDHLHTTSTQKCCFLWDSFLVPQWRATTVCVWMWGWELPAQHFTILKHFQIYCLIWSTIS